MPKKIKKCVNLDDAAIAEISARCKTSRRSFSAELEFAVLEYRFFKQGGAHPSITASEVSNRRTPDQIAASGLN